MAVDRSESAPKAMAPTYQAIVALTDAFCKEHLDEEWAAMGRSVTAALCRKRPSPLATGKPEVWACAVVHAVGTVNFLFDRSQPYYISAADIAAAFGVGKTTGAAKAKVVRDALDMYQFAPKWTLPSMLEENPYVWMAQVDGLIVDLRHAPRDLQEEAFRRGLIPYIPGERPSGG